MLKSCRFAALIALSVSFAPLGSRAEPFVATVPGQAWAITMDAPPLANYLGQSKGDAFQFRATSGEDGFNVTIFVEKPQGQQKTHEAVFNYYWPKAKQNPLIDASSIKIAKGSKFVKVSYRFDVGQGQENKNRQVNYYFFYKDRWIDVHISKMPFADADEKVFDAFEKALSYGPIKPAVNGKSP